MRLSKRFINVEMAILETASFVFYMKTILLLLLSFVFIQCNAQVKDSTNMQRKPIDQVLKSNQEMLLAIPGVQGYYQGEFDNGDDCIVIMVDSLKDVNIEKFPDSLEGYPVRVEETGKIEPLGGDQK